MVRCASTLTYVFYQKKITFTLGFSLGQHPSGNLQPFGGKNYPIRHQQLRIHPASHTRRLRVPKFSASRTKTEISKIALIQKPSFGDEIRSDSCTRAKVSPNRFWGPQIDFESKIRKATLIEPCYEFVFLFNGNNSIKTLIL